MTLFLLVLRLSFRHLPSSTFTSAPCSQCSSSQLPCSKQVLSSDTVPLDLVLVLNLALPLSLQLLLFYGCFDLPGVLIAHAHAYPSSPASTRVTLNIDGKINQQWSQEHHGPWDTNVIDQAPVTNPHTSIQDMTASVLLYTRAGIDMSIGTSFRFLPVVAVHPLTNTFFSLAWYGRTHQLEDATCPGYNCTVRIPSPILHPTSVCQLNPHGHRWSAAARKVHARRPRGTSRNSRSRIYILAGGITPTLDSTSETYWFDNAGELVTFDQANTWAIKQTFAEATCLGGTLFGPLMRFFRTETMVLVEMEDLGARPFIHRYGKIPTTGGAASETFVGAGSTAVVLIPTTTTFITVGGGMITLTFGGTPVDALIPSTVSEPNAITRNWTYNIIPSTSAPSITFTPPPISGSETFSTVVPSPSNGVIPITGPAGEAWPLDILHIHSISISLLFVPTHSMVSTIAMFSWFKAFAPFSYPNSAFFAPHGSSPSPPRLPLLFVSSF
ncbi:hypothetical protein B0H11DRAFT_2220096 [Mycena galericulata]|nr:hypothetical protein B0H11DRAFT_2220096 [Mycena galericulata]